MVEKEEKKVKKLTSPGARLAALLLLRDGELSISDIEAIPFVPDPESARAIALSLVNLLEAQWEQRSTRRAGVTFWEDYIRLKSAVILRKQLTKAGTGRTKEESDNIPKRISCPLESHFVEEENSCIGCVSSL